MGRVTTEVTISNPAEASLQSTVEGLVDTAATFTVVPRALAVSLQLPITGTRLVRTATGDVQMDRARAVVQIDGQSEINPVLISDTLDRVLIGVITLETLSLTVDPTRGELREADTLLY
ncbi:MAG: retroviral-like aspartic protease family protein [Dehalococcoidia bacterium]